MFQVLHPQHASTLQGYTWESSLTFLKGSYCYRIWAKWASQGHHSKFKLLSERHHSNMNAQGGRTSENRVATQWPRYEEGSQMAPRCTNSISSHFYNSCPFLSPFQDFRSKGRYFWKASYLLPFEDAGIYMCVCMIVYNIYIYICVCVCACNWKMFKYVQIKNYYIYILYLIYPNFICHCTSSHIATSTDHFSSSSSVSSSFVLVSECCSFVLPEPSKLHEIAIEGWLALEHDPVWIKISRCLV